MSNNYAMVIKILYSVQNCIKNNLFKWKHLRHLEMMVEIG